MAIHNQLPVQEVGFGEVRIKGVNAKLIIQLNNVASWLGIPMSQMLRPLLREFVEKQSDKYRYTNARKDDHELDNTRMLKEIQEIADNVGVPVTELLRSYLKDCKNEWSGNDTGK